MGFVDFWPWEVLNKAAPRAVFKAALGKNKKVHVLNSKSIRGAKMSKRIRSFCASEELLAKIKEAAEKENKNQSEWICELLNKYFDRSQMLVNRSDLEFIDKRLKELENKLYANNMLNKEVGNMSKIEELNKIVVELDNMSNEKGLSDQESEQLHIYANNLRNMVKEWQESVPTETAEAEPEAEPETKLGQLEQGSEKIQPEPQKVKKSLCGFRARPELGINGDY